MSKPSRDARATPDHAMIVDLSLDSVRLKQLYRGVARSVVVRARDGRWVQFPAQALRAHVDGRGVHGTFVLRVRGGRLAALERIAATS